MRKIIKTAIATGVFGTAVLGAAVLAAGPASSEGTDLVVVGERFTSQDTDTVPAGASDGDLYAAGDKLSTPDGKEIGQAGLSCVATGVVSEEQLDYLCTFVLRLPDGEITMASLDADGDAVHASIPVTGGSGKYSGASGTAELVEIDADDDPGTFKYRVELDLR